MNSAVASKEYRPPLLVDGYLVATALLLSAFSLVMLYSTTGIFSSDRFGDPLFFVKKQGAALFVGVVAMYFASKVPVRIYERVSPVLFPIALFLLILPLIPGIGDAAGGARRWVALGPIRFQPGEPVKLLFIIFMAGYLARQQQLLAEFVSGVFKPLFLVGSVGVLYLAQPDFGSMAVLTTVTIAMTAAAGMRLRYLGFAILFIALAFSLLVFISPYRLSRVLSFMTPWSDASGRGYQLIQSLIAIGTGQVYGVGLGESQQKLFFLPAAHTDFIFAVIAEELGFVGCVAVVFLFLVILWRGVKVARKVASDTFRFSLAVGLTLLIIVPAFLNMGVVTGLLPTKGLVLPLIGYGGSSLITSLSGLGVLLSIARQSNQPR